MSDGRKEWMDLCERMFSNAIHSGVTGAALDDLEEEYEEARRMYRLHNVTPVIAHIFCICGHSHRWHTNGRGGCAGSVANGYKGALCRCKRFKKASGAESVSDATESDSANGVSSPSPSSAAMESEKEKKDLGKPGGANTNDRT